MATWSSKWNAAIPEIGDQMTYQIASSKLRQLIKSNLLSLVDINQNPERFFEAHRLVAQKSSKLGPGFSIRFTVHYNLFAGTVVGLGTDSQVAEMLARNAISPKLGCFALTEVFAGVNSGLVVNTTAVFENGKFVFNTPNPGAAKNWISQGLVADEAVVVATTFVNGKSIGPQAFLVTLRVDGKLQPGVEALDMGRKTVGNDLDNARLSFKNFEVSLDSMLAKYVSISPDGKVSYPLGAKYKSIEMIGQRLFSGRVAVAQACLVYSKTLFENTKAFANQKKCWTPGSETPLINVPQIKSIFRRADVEFDKLFKFMSIIEHELCQYLKQNKVPPVSLQESIAVGKVKAIEGCMTLCHALKQEVGSYALMAGTGFEQIDFITCCKFAEGDSRILMQKMARDVLTRGPSNDYERAAVHKLKAGLLKEVQSGKSKKDAWDECFELVYELADAHMQGVLDKVLAPASKL